MFDHKEQQGFMTLAIGADYLKMAYLQALKYKVSNAQCTILCSSGL